MKSVCVFCGSSMGLRPSYKQSAQKLGETLVNRGLQLVYGGASVGLMGVVADTVLSRGGQVIGVIPEFLANKEIAHIGLTELYIVDSMHERKTKMAELADAFIALPGGYGTLEEFCEILTWAQLRLHDKPCGLLNIEGYFDPLLQLFDQAVTEQFLKPNLRALVLQASQPEELLNLFANYKPNLTDKWINKEVKP